LSYDLANLLSSQEAFKLKTKSFYDLENLLCSQEAFTIKSEIDLQAHKHITFIRSF